MRVPTALCYWVGLFCMLVALALQTLTLASQRYHSVLLSAMGLTIVADVCLGVAAWHGGVGRRAAAAITMLPTLFIIYDFLRRGTYVF